MRNWRTLKGYTQFWRDPLALVSRATPAEYVDEVRRAGCDALVAGDERVDLRAALELLAAERGVTRVRVDSGGALAGALLAAGLVHEISLMVYPVLVGGAEEHTFNRRRRVRRRARAARHAPARRSSASTVSTVASRACATRSRRRLSARRDRALPLRRSAGPS